MPDSHKLDRLKMFSFRRGGSSCSTCKYANKFSRTGLGECQHPETKYVHEKYGEQKMLNHYEAICNLHEPVYSSHLAKLFNQMWRK